MSEVEKLYKNAGVEPNFCTYPRYCNDEDCSNCPNFSYLSEFTPEKQLSLIKILTQRCDLTISHFSEWEFMHYDGQEALEITGKDFTETFAKLINAYWQDLTEQERTEIADILKG